MTDFLHYNKKFKGRARDLRKQGVLSEVLLWNQLRAQNNVESVVMKIKDTVFSAKGVL
jgi:very-short-patch-repair endonuclease